MNERSIRLSTHRRGGLKKRLKIGLATYDRLRHTRSGGSQGVLHNYPHGAHTRPGHWSQVAVGGMTPPAIVEHLNVIEDDILGLLTGVEPLQVDAFGL